MGLEIPGYKILRTLGRGGMATVYLAQQEIFERQVALKIMSKALASDESFGKRFFREAKIVSQLVHPNIVTVHDVGMHGEHYFLSMEYIDGSDLKHIRNKLSLRQKIQAVVDIAKALQYAGQKGYIHRDIKPENIMFHKQDGRAVLTDFGIAKAAEADTSMTQAGTAIGTPHYMSPEQAKGKDVDPRSDIYSLGVVFFLLLAGHVPFDAESAVAIGIKHITEPVPLLPEGLEALQPIIDTLLAKKPENRYQTAGEFIEDIGMLNIELLEQSFNFARGQQLESVDSNSPTQKNLAISAVDVALVYDDQDTIINERTSAMSWFIGFLIVVSLVGWLLYYQNPARVVSWLEKGKTLMEQTYHSVEGAIQEPQAPTSEKNVQQAPQQKKTTESTRRLVGNAPPPATDQSIVKTAPKPKPKPAPSPTAAPTPVPTPSISQAEYEQKLQSLRERYAGDTSYLSRLVALHRDYIRDYPQQSAAVQSLVSLRRQELSGVAALINEGKTEAAGKKLQQLRVLFPDTPSKTFGRLEGDIQRETRVQSLLADGRRYLQQQDYTSPAERNAAARFSQVLTLDSGNVEAQKGLQEALAQSISSGRKDFDRGRLPQALAKSEQVLAFDSKNRTAQALHTRAKQAIEYQAQIENWFALAARRSQSHHYFLPEQDCAYLYYQNILTREPGNTRAITGQKRVIDDFARNVWSLVGDEEFTEARKQMAAALRRLPDNSRLQSLSAAVEEVLADKVITP